jgi:hypothetical protein
VFDDKGDGMLKIFADKTKILLRGMIFVSAEEIEYHPPVGTRNKNPPIKED